MKTIQKGMKMAVLLLVLFSIASCGKKDDGALSGLFSVSADTKVQFSHGNLQYQASKKKWRFAENQWDWVGGLNNGTVYSDLVRCNNAEISEKYEGWIDLFGWGTGDKPNLSGHKGYDMFVDWGINTISNGGKAANPWRTLTKDEWEYLFHGRANAEKLFGFGNVYGVYGIIILPDNWDLPNGYTFTPSVTKGLTWIKEGEGFGHLKDFYHNSKFDNYSHNYYYYTDWAVLEAAGAVFLPAAGDRIGADYGCDGSKGKYWSSTPYDSYDSFCISFDNGNLFIKDNRNRVYMGCSVRLVRDIQD